MGKRNVDGTWRDSCLDKVLPNEPIFVLRAQDVTAPSLVRKWATVNKSTISSEKYNEALNCANEMDKWPSRKLPD